VRDVVTNILGFVYSFRASDFRRLKECIPSCISSIRRAHTARVATKKPLHLPPVQLQLTTTDAAAAVKFSTNKTIVDNTAAVTATTTNLTPLTSEPKDFDKAWSILNNPALTKDQENAAMLKHFLEELGAMETTALMACDDEDIIELSNKLKKIPKKNFLQALRK